MRLDLDHLAVSAATLAQGVALIEALLGVQPAPGGVHPRMGTHNRLLSLGPGLYLEVIAIDPAAANPEHPRWFGLDRFEGPPRLTNWICRTDDLDAALGAAPKAMGPAVALSRGDFRWRFAVPPGGILPFDDAHPALIQWQGPAHPAQALPDSGCRLRRLVVTHPQALALRQALAALTDPRVEIVAGDTAMMAEIDTPSGLRVLQ